MRIVSFAIGILIAACIVTSLSAQDTASTRNAAKAETNQTGQGSRDAKEAETSSAREFEDLRQKRRAILDELSQLSQTRLEQQRILNQYQDKKISLTTNMESISAKIATFNVEQFNSLINAAQDMKTKLKNDLASEEQKSPPDQTIIQNYGRYSGK
jgi:chromosome segregation ATPase